MMRLWRLRRRVRKHPDDGAARVALARALHGEGDRAGALAAALAATDCTSEPGDGLALGELLVELGDVEAGERTLRQAWSAGPDAPGVAAALGRFLAGQGRSAEAVAPLRVAVAAEPDDRDLRAMFADALHGAGQLERSADAWRTLVETGPDDVRSRLQLGRVLLDLGDAAGGIAALRSARSMTENAETTTSLGIALARHGRASEAVALFENHLLKRPDSVAALVNCGLAHAEIGDEAGAVRYLIDAARRAPDNATVQQNLGLTFLRMGHLDAALGALRKASALEPRSPRVQLLLARTHARRGDVHPAIAAATLAQELSGDDPASATSAAELLAVLMETATGEYPALSMSSDGLDRPSAMSGVLAEFPLPNLLEFLRSDRRTGTLQIVSMEGMGEVRLRDGDLVAVSASGVPRLGQMLVDAGHIDRRALVGALSERPEGVPLGRHLVAAGLVTADAVSATVREQARLGLVELLTRGEGQFDFMIDPGLDVPESWPTQGLLLDALRHLDEQGHADAGQSMEEVLELFESEGFD